MIWNLSPRIAVLTAILSAAAVAPGAYSLRETGEQTSDPLTVHIRGVGAPSFDAADWTSGPPHLVADVRHPLLEPREGNFRNIYAPSAVPRPEGGWYVYYGAWDGIDEGRDTIYVTTTNDFSRFGERRTVVLPGPELQHVCNVNGQAAADGLGVTLMCTAYPDNALLNKPVVYQLEKPVPEAPITATKADMVRIEGYDGYAGADINGMNVLLRDEGRSLLYFGDFKNFGAVRVATGDAGATGTFTLTGTALSEPLAVNDVKILRDAAGKKHYLMGLHMNRGALYYSLSDDPLLFTTTTELLRSTGEADKHIVALGWVTDKDSSTDAARPAGARRVLGVLYGAGAAQTLDANRIFARWFQKRLEFSGGGVDGGTNGDGNGVPQVKGALGPSVSEVSLPGKRWSGELMVLAGEGKPGDKVTSVTLEGGKVYELLRLSPYAGMRGRSMPHGTGPQHDPECECLTRPVWVRP